MTLEKATGTMGGTLHISISFPEENYTKLA